MGQGPQKADHRGNFYIVPRSLQDSVAWRHASLRARAILQVFQFHHDGWNNGDITMSIKQIGKALGDQCHGANARAVAELVTLGFLECTADASHSQSKARTYRLTFISTGRQKQTPATKEYESWRPAPGMKKAFGGSRSAGAMKSGGAVTAARASDSAAVATTPVKFPVAVAATDDPAIAEFQTISRIAVTAAHLGNHSSGSSDPFPCPAAKAHETRSILVQPDELREWTKAAIAAGGYGSAKQLAEDAGVPQPALSRFKQGRSLPEAYRQPLQEACGRRLPYRAWASQCGAGGTARSG